MTYKERETVNPECFVCVTISLSKFSGSTARKLQTDHVRIYTSLKIKEQIVGTRKKLE